MENYDEFVKIKDGNRPYYGGNQSWYENETSKKVGCAAVAAANITAFISKNTSAKSLYKYKTFNKNEYIKHMEDVIRFVKPDKELGVISSVYFMDKVTKFALSRNVQLESQFVTIAESYEKINNFIKNSLKKNRPIALLMLRNKKLSEYDWHWVTVTKYYRNEYNTYLTISTWGEKKIISLYDFYNYSAYGTLVTFSLKR